MSNNKIQNYALKIQNFFKDNTDKIERLFALFVGLYIFFIISNMFLGVLLFGEAYCSFIILYFILLPTLTIISLFLGLFSLTFALALILYGLGKID